MRLVVSFATSVLWFVLSNWLQFASAGDAADIGFVSGIDQSRQSYVLFDFADDFPDRQRDLLIALHGHGSDRWQFATQERDECRGVRDFAREHGMLFVSPDYRAKTSWMGPLAEADVLQIIQELKEKYQIKRVFICGGSMGGSSALTFTALHPELISGVVALNGTANHLEYQNFQEAISESFGGKKSEIPEQYKMRSAEYWPERFTMPVGLTTGGRDSAVPPGSVIRLASVLQQLERPVLLIHREEGGHESNYEDTRAALDFMLEAANRKTPQSTPSP
ncbi:alpha/beta hydrolase family protein [Planctomicrobium sp. SH661]|uniref:alpha/beta hydrolase family protein n=1 Tax=Planctomicrobium sp. SH661 TaxID=3448124 RepID=UPI003F5B3E54